MDKLVDNKMINKIEKLLQEARTHVAVEVNNTLLRTYKEIGKLLVEDIDLHENEENSRMLWHSWIQYTKRIQPFRVCNYVEK